MRGRALLSVFAALMVSAGLFAAGARADTLTVFAAASLKNALDEVGIAWKAYDGGSIAPSYASSSTLAKQIEQGAPADVFISADQQWMDYLTDRKLVRDPRPVLGNRLVLIAPKSKETTIDIRPGFDLAGLLGGGRLAVGDPTHVPAGLYAKQALTKLGVWNAVEPRLAPAADVRAALALVARGEAPLGIVYETDAKVEPEVATAGIFPDDSHDPIVYPAAIVATSKNPEAAKFLAYLSGPAATAIFERYGFRPIR
ncbi:MAG TPA: molybdate ABC transporter substrate-binding protein [Alphaproteobacteria bacterium]|nr:molybdate ABC transporter substrate-binding protein [Alphaproteobacteria bacterium]